MSDAPSPFWTFSLTVYREPGVQRECLDLQDRCGIDVNLLLFCAFLGAVHGAVLPGDDMKQAADKVKEWHENVVVGLRSVRRALKSLAAAEPSSPDRQTFRENVMALELEAERFEQMLLERWGAARRESWRRTHPLEAIRTNLETLFAIDNGSVPPRELPSCLVATALEVAGTERGS